MKLTIVDLKAEYDRKFRYAIEDLEAEAKVQVAKRFHKEKIIRPTDGDSIHFSCVNILLF